MIDSRDRSIGRAIQRDGKLDIRSLPVMAKLELLPERGAKCQAMIIGTVSSMSDVK
jgi:hypothetical protein